MKKLLLIVTLISSLSVYAQDCKYMTNETDAFTGTKKVVTKSERLYKDKMMEIKISAAQIGERTVFYWSFIINTSSAYSDYGYLDTDLNIMFKADTSILTLPIGDNSTGKSNYQYNYTIYSTFTTLDKDDIKYFSEKNIDAIRVYWSKGYEDYTIENKSMFMKHINCIK